jgi:hypothetical protein
MTTMDETDREAMRLRQRQSDLRVQRAIDEARYVTAGGALGLLATLALSFALLGVPGGVLATLASFCTLATCVGADRLHSVLGALR